MVDIALDRSTSVRFLAGDDFHPASDRPDYTRILPEPLHTNKITVLDDRGSSVLFRIDPPWGSLVRRQRKWES